MFNKFNNNRILIRACFKIYQLNGMLIALYAKSYDLRIVSIILNAHILAFVPELPITYQLLDKTLTLIVVEVPIGKFLF